jgi:hypothetical protein
MRTGLEEIAVHAGESRVHRESELFHRKIALLRRTLVAIHLCIPVYAAAQDCHDSKVGKCEGGTDVGGLREASGHDDANGGGNGGNAV